MDAPLDAAPDRTVAASALFEQVCDAYHCAAAAAGERTVDLAIGGRSVSLRFAGEALTPLFLPALAHLAAPAGAIPDLTVTLFDSESTGVQPPASPWTQAQFGARGDVDCGEGVRASFAIDTGTLSLYEPRSSRAVVWIRTPAAVPPWDRAAPFRGLLSWWAAESGAQLAHGACVGTDRGGVLLCARGGSGKSTTALACLGAGFQYVGDDYVLLEDGAPPRAHSLYRSAKLFPAQQARFFADLAAERQPDPDCRSDKTVFLIGDEHPDQVARSLPLRAVLIPRLGTGAGTHAVRVPAGQAVLALAPTTVFQLPGAGARELAALAALARRLPCWSLTLGHDLDGVVAAIRAILDGEPVS